MIWDIQDGMNETRISIGWRGLHQLLKCPQCLFIVIRTFVHCDKRGKHMT